VRYEQIVGHLRKRFGGMAANAITVMACDEYRSVREAEGAAAKTIHEELSRLQQMFRLAGRKLDFALKRPDVEKPAVDNARPGFFTPTQVRDVVRHLPPCMRPSSGSCS